MRKGSWRCGGKHCSHRKFLADKPKAIGIIRNSPGSRRNPIPWLRLPVTCRLFTMKRPGAAIISTAEKSVSAVLAQKSSRPEGNCVTSGSICDGNSSNAIRQHMRKRGASSFPNRIRCFALWAVTCANGNVSGKTTRDSPGSLTSSSARFPTARTRCPRCRDRRQRLRARAPRFSA